MPRLNPSKFGRTAWFRLFYFWQLFMELKKLSETTLPKHEFTYVLLFASNSLLNFHLSSSIRQSIKGRSCWWQVDSRGWSLISRFFSNYLPACYFCRVCLTDVTGLIVSRPLVNIGLKYVAFLSIKPYERMPLQRFKNITGVAKYSLTQGVRKAIWKDAFTLL